MPVNLEAPPLNILGAAGAAAQPPLGAAGAEAWALDPATFVFSTVVGHVAPYFLRLISRTAAALETAPPLTSREFGLALWQARSLPASRPSST
jgi:hypothetical protein